MMNKGYICVVQNNDNVDYLRAAYALALSLNNTQSKVKKLSIVTDMKVPKKYKYAFDEVISIKKDRAKNAGWKLHNLVDLYEYSPYDETVILDSDMLFLTDVSHWWNTLTKKDIWFTTNTKTFRDELSPTNTIYRQQFIKNELPSIYMAFFYFKKCDDAKILFNMAKGICENWKEVETTYLNKMKPGIFSTDITFALATKLTGLTEKATMPQFPFPYFTHMKTENQNWDLDGYKVHEDWRKYINVSFDEFNSSLGIKLGTLRQFAPLHYYIKEFLTDDMIKILKAKYE